MSETKPREINGFTIESDVPLSEAARLTRFPWSEMGLGESFAVPDASVAASARQSAAHYRRRTDPNFNYTCRKQPDGTYRVWRLS